MPIKPENKGRYPADWPAIRERILARAGGRCERCKVLNHTHVARGAGDDTGTYMDADGNVYRSEDGYSLGSRHLADYNIARMVYIVLTIAHLHDPSPENCAEDNLRALCQRHHLAHDHQHHIATAQATRRAGRAVGDLFAEVQP